MITRQDLKNFRHLKNEIQILDRQIKEIGYDVVSDTVKGSGKDFPYMEHTITITGLDVRGHAEKVRRMQRRLERRKADLQDQWADIDTFIRGIDDLVTRQVIELKFIDGLSWEQVAKNIGGGNSPEGLRKRLQRFLKTG